jgi:hypothetical protein
LTRAAQELIAKARCGNHDDRLQQNAESQAFCLVN